MLKYCFVIAAFMLTTVSSQAHQSNNHGTKEDKNCINGAVTCAKTVTSGFSPDGRLWRLYADKRHLYYSISQDQGKHFAEPIKIAGINEKISARGENRPKIGFDDRGYIYLSWARPLAKRFTAEVRFSYSSDGKTFSAPMTVNNDGLTTGHSFNEMLVSPQGGITITWLDGRERKKHQDYQGSALYTAFGSVVDGKVKFNNQNLADNTCVCCRISMAHTQDHQVAVFWRHIYDDNIRDHALLTYSPQTQVAKNQGFRATFDQWQINGCPHQGPGISINRDQRYHLVWYNNGPNDGLRGTGVFYAYSDDGGKTQSPAIRLGDTDARAAHAHVLSIEQQVDLVWTQYDGDKHQLLHQRSVDGGDTFSQARVIASSNTQSDRPFIIKHGKKAFVSWHRGPSGHWFKAL